MYEQVSLGYTRKCFSISSRYTYQKRSTETWSLLCVGRSVVCVNRSVLCVNGSRWAIRANASESHQDTRIRRDLQKLGLFCVSVGLFCV